MRRGRGLAHGFAVARRLRVDTSETIVSPLLLLRLGVSSHERNYLSSLFWWIRPSVLCRAARTLAQLASDGTILATELFPGGVAERLIAPVLKTGRPKGLVSSNLTPSASLLESTRDG